jgi:hypothetical protein
VLFETPVDIEAPAQRVWDVLTDLAAWPRRIETVDVARFTLVEDDAGPLLPLIWRSMPDLQPSFDHTRGLQRHVEQEAPEISASACTMSA